MTFEQAISFALDMAQRRQRPAYVVELAAGWGASSCRPRRRHFVHVEAPARDMVEGEDDPE